MPKIWGEMYISEIKFENIRCFKDFCVTLCRDGKLSLWTTISGDNATGKTTLLRSIAIGLCDESSAAGLLKESEEGYIRRENAHGKIKISFLDEENPANPIHIETIITAYHTKENKYFEKLRQTTYPEVDFPWDEIFACAYGAGRGTAGTADIAGYSTINAVYNLFNYSEGLQNPELTIRRIGKPHWVVTVKDILNCLMETDKINIPNAGGIEIDGKWGKKMPLRDLADGYKTTFLWVTDFLGWVLSDDDSVESKQQIKGIVLIDELEQHLHPKWQRLIVSRLKDNFPHVQFITTTHSPLIATNAGTQPTDVIESRLLHLGLKGKNEVTVTEIEENLNELNCDQILSSEAFDHILNINTKVTDLLNDASELAAQDERTPEDNKKLELFKNELKKLMFPQGRTLIERVVEREYYQELEKKIEDFKKILEG